jgi:hypothetical protein
VPRLLLAIAASAALLAGVPAAPVPRERDPYFPTAVGARWAYRFENARPGEIEGKEHVEVVTAVERKGGVTYVVFGEPTGDGTIGCPYVMAVSAGGLHYGVNHGTAGPEKARLYTFYNWELRLPWSAGDTWESDVALGDSTRKTRYTNHGVERVKVPAGEYTAVKVSSDHVGRDGTRQLRTAWYARGVGKVKWSLGEDGAALVLTSFTPGKG